MIEKRYVKPRLIGVHEVRYVITQNEAGKIVYQFPSN